MRRMSLLFPALAVFGAVVVSISGCKPGESSYAIAAFASPTEIAEGESAKVNAAVMKNDSPEKDVDVTFSSSGCGTMSKKSEKTNADGNAVASFAGAAAADTDCVATIFAQTHGLKSNTTVTVHPKPVEADVAAAQGATLPTPVPHVKVSVKVREVVKGKQWQWVYLVGMKDGGFDKILMTLDAAGTVTSAAGGNVSCMLPGGECKMWKITFSGYTSSAALTVDSGGKPGGSVNLEIIRGTTAAGRSEDYSAALKVTAPKGE